MDEHNEKRLGDPDMGTDPAMPATGRPTVTLTVGGTDAGPAVGPNPVIGTPRLPGAPPAPPPVIHAAGEGRPGEANPAAGDTTASGEPAVSTAQLLADREASETAIRAGERAGQPSMAASPAGDTPYADTTADPLLARDAQGGGSAGGDAAEPLLGVLTPSKTETALGLNTVLQGGLVPRMIRNEQRYGEAAQSAGSQSGLDAAHSTYEHLEYGEAQTNELRDDVLEGATGGLAGPPRSAATVHATFAAPAAAHDAVRALRDIGIAEGDIQLGEAGPGTDVPLTVRTDQLTHDLVVRVLRANGAHTVA